MPLTENEIAKIRQEAEALYPIMPDPSMPEIVTDRYEPLRQAHIAAVIAERERAQKIAIAYETWCREELWQHEYREQRTFADEEKYFTFINQYNP